MTPDIKPFLHYYIGTGAEVEYVKRGTTYLAGDGQFFCTLDLHAFCYLQESTAITSIRFTNLISIDELTDEQKVRLYDTIIPEGKSERWEKIVWVNHNIVLTLRYEPRVFHELLQMRVDLFNLKEKT